MLPLLVWLAGIVFGFWCIWHWGFTREAWAFSVCASVFAWMVGGAAWLGQKLQAAGAAARMASGQPYPGRLPQLSEKDRADMKRAASQQTNE